ncbi:LPXTG cell wall anchor domain-containing protein, partial [Burkholderia contaminans]|nr:LPXTG cell wall anchor domain-containing protein [Burkholderia contaminans]
VITLTSGAIFYFVSGMFSHILGFRLETNLRKRGVNGTEPAVHEIAEYKGSDSLVTLTTKEDYTYKAPLAQQALPETGNKESDLLASLGLTAFFLGLFTLGKKREQ